MKATLHESSLERYETVYEGQTVKEIMGESVVSDKMPDIGLLGDTNACVLLRSKRVETGAAVMEGDLLIELSYVPDGAAGFCVLKMQLPWMAEFQSEAIAGGNAAVGKVRIAHLETRMLNPRKVLVKAQLQGEIRVFASVKDSVYDDSEEAEIIQVCKEELSCSVISAVCEKTFAATDEYPLPPGLTGSEVMGKSVQFRVDDIKTLTNKLIVKGSVHSDVVIGSAEGEAERISFTSPFSFICETECQQVSENVRPDIMPTAMYYELTSSGRSLSVEVHGVCQMTVYEKRELKYLSDAYSNFYPCSCEYEKLRVYQEVKKAVHRENVSGNIVCRSQLACVRVLNASYTHGDGQINVHVGACVAYENGSQDWVRKQMTIPASLKNGESICEVRLNDLYGGCSGTELEFRFNVEWDTITEERLTLTPLVGVEWDENEKLAQKESSFSVVRGGGSLWELARKYSSTVQLIKTYNELEEDMALPNTVLLIPRQRKR